MPNHVINRLEFECSEERLKELLSAICYDNNAETETVGIGTIDFNKIIPMPESLDIECGSRTDRGIDLYLTSINPFVAYFGDKKMENDRFLALNERLNAQRFFIRHNAYLTLEEIEKHTKYDSREELIKLGKTCTIKNFAYRDVFIPQGSIAKLQSEYGVNSQEIEDYLMEILV